MLLPVPIDPPFLQHLRNLLMTDQQLIDVLKKGLPGFAWARQTLDVRDAWSGQNHPASDCWVFSYDSKEKPESMAVKIVDDAWPAWRYGMYCCYVALLSGGAS